MNCINCGRDVSNPAERVAGDYKPMCLYCFNRGFIPLGTNQPSPIPDFRAQPQDGLAPRADLPAPQGSGGVECPGAVVHRAKRGGRREGAGRKAAAAMPVNGRVLSVGVDAALHADILKYKSICGHARLSVALRELIEIGIKHAQTSSKQLNNGK